MSRSALLALAAGLALAMPAVSLAEKKPEDPVEKRFKDIEKQVRQLKSIVLQARDTGQPVSVRLTTEPDPIQESLQTRMDDLEGASRTRNDQIDTLVHDLEAARRENTDARTQLKTDEDRIAKLEARLKAIEDTLAAQVQAAQAAAPPPGASTVGPGGPAGASPPADIDPVQAEAAFRRARQLLLEGQYAPASRAFQQFVDSYGDSQWGPEGRYWLGETQFIRGLYADAATSYIGAIRGWPQTPWAADAVVKLARSLVALNKSPDACRTLVEFGRRYPNASATAKARAAEVRSQAACA